MARRLVPAFEELEGAAGTAAPTARSFALKCQYCASPIPPERGPKARYCKKSHRVIAHKARKRAEQRAANKAAAAVR